MVAVQDAGPYLFELTHEDTKIEYIPRSLNGRPKLNYSGPMGRYSFEGDEIQTYEGARGLEISVTLDGVSHLRTNTLTFFVPDIELDDRGELTFQTVGMHSIRRRGITRVGEPLSSEPLEFDGLVRNVTYRRGAPVLL